MRDWKAALKNIELAKPEATQGPGSIELTPNEDLSNYEEFRLAQKKLSAESALPIKTRDFELVLHLQKRVQYFQRLHQEEVAKYRNAFPSASHEEISKKAQAIRRAEEENDKKEKLTAATRAEEEEKRLAKEQKQLTSDAKRLIRDRSLVVCAVCKDGRVETDCPTCDGSGHVEPYVFPVIKQVIQGANAYTVKSLESRTKCPEKKCHDGTVFDVCPHCDGLQICTKAGKPLHKLTRAKKALVARVRELLGLPN